MTTQAQRKAMLAKEISEVAARKGRRALFVTADGWTVPLTDQDSVTVLASGEAVKAPKAPVGERVQVAGLGTARRLGNRSTRLLMFVSSDVSYDAAPDEVVNRAHKALSDAGLFVTFAESWEGP